MGCFQSVPLSDLLKSQRKEYGLLSLALQLLGTLSFPVASVAPNSVFVHQIRKSAGFLLRFQLSPTTPNMLFSEVNSCNKCKHSVLFPSWNSYCSLECICFCSLSSPFQQVLPPPPISCPELIIVRCGRIRLQKLIQLY